MATSSPTTTTIKQEETHPPPPPPATNECIKGEPQDLANGSLPQPESEPDGDSAQLTKSVNDLNDLAKAIQAFKNRYDELQNHLNFIDQAIDARQKELASPPSATPIPQNDVVQSNSETAKPEKEKEKRERVMKKEKESENESEIVSLCKTMCSRGLRKYIVSNLSNPNLLREQVPEALKSSPKPSKLVFECIGRFFLQGSRAYTKDSPMIPARNASVLVLELFLLSGCVESEKEVEASLKEEAAMAAVAWRKRLIMEGGLAKASEADARGLILFVACFGVPSAFRNEDVCNLVRLSNPGEISQALRQSQGMIRKASDIAEEMMKKGSVVEALDLAYTFGFEEKFSPATSLTSFLQKSEDAWKKSKQDSRDTPGVLKEADEKYLAALKSVVNCLEGHKIDFIKLLPGWQLKDKIVNLEKSIGDAKKKIEEKSVAKRKVDKSSSSNKVKVPETKRSRFTFKDPPMPSAAVMALQDHRMTSHMNVNSSYDGALTSHLLDGRSYGYSSYYPTASSVQIGSVSGSLPESYLGGTIASGINMHGGSAAGSYSYSGYHGDMILDNGGSMLHSNSNPYRFHEIDGGLLSTERSIGQSFVGQPTSARVNSLYGKSSVDGFAGLPDHPAIGVSSRRGSDLYSFADSVFDT